MTVRLRVPAVDDPQFVADWDDRARVLKLIGSADNATATGLAGLLEDLHGELLARRAPQIIVDMRDLDFLGTACVTELLAWIERLAELAERYTIKLRANPTIAWQRTALPALSCFATALVTVET